MIDQNVPQDNQYNLAFPSFLGWKYRIQAKLRPINVRAVIFQIITLPA